METEDQRPTKVKRSSKSGTQTCIVIVYLKDKIYVGCAKFGDIAFAGERMQEK